jgi:hypothetical protein
MSYLHIDHTHHEGGTASQRILGTLVFKRSELLYDVGNYAFVEGDIREAKSEHERHQVIDIAQEGNVDRVNRILDLAYHEAIAMLYPYTEEPATDDVTLSDELSAPECYIVRLSLPTHFSATTITLLSKLLHEYLVSRVMQDWMSITNASAEAHWREKCDQLRAAVSSALTARGCVARRRLHPF